MKPLFLCATAFLFLTFALTAADDARRIAKVDAEQLQDTAVSILLSKPENAAKKEAFEKLHGELTAVQAQMGNCKDEESLKQCQQKFSQATRKEEEFKQSLEPDIKRVISNAVREVSKGRFVAVFDSGSDSGLVFKDVELVDITYDIKEKLLDATPAPAPVVVSPAVTDVPALR